MAVKGMDWASGQSVIPRFQDLSSQINDEFQNVQQLLEAAQWTGDDAERFMSEYQGLVSQANSVAQAITQLGEEFRGHVEGQRTASSQ